MKLVLPGTAQIVCHIICGSNLLRQLCMSAVSHHVRGSSTVNIDGCTQVVVALAIRPILSLKP